MLVCAGLKRLVLCHLNHGLRGRESGQDAAFVRRLAVHYGLPCEIEKAAVNTWAATHKTSIETAARTLRYDFLYRMAAKHGAARIYLAHHADDQAETILANLCRGTGIGGLKGMVMETRSMPALCRPLLDKTRAEIAEYVQTHGLSFREDSSNASPQHRRNRLRHEVLPLLNAVYAREVSLLIVRLGKQAERDDDCLQQQALALIQDEGLITEEGRLRVTAKLRSQHPALLSRVLHFWLGEVLTLPGLDSELLEAASALLRPGGVAKVNLPEGRHLRRKAGYLWVTAPA